MTTPALGPFSILAARPPLTLSDQTPFLGILMVLGTVALVFGAVAWLVVRSLGKHPHPLRAIAVGLGAWATLYALLLLATSLASKERVLALDEDKKFCGFYLDCHTQAAVVTVERLDSLGALRPEGQFFAVTLRISSDARRAQMRLLDPRVLVRDAAGRIHRRSAAGEAAFGQVRGAQPPLTDTVGAGGSYTTTVVFDLPRDARDPRLDITDGFWVDRLIELFLIGDEDSLLHKRTTIRLAA